MGNLCAFVKYGTDRVFEAKLEFIEQACLNVRAFRSGETKIVVFLTCRCADDVLKLSLSVVSQQSKVNRDCR